ncbi:histidine kinase [Hymenobacter sp. H14-R3]|uniref:sensor histidine kinase n=1 Tax=Hymenobacter sp. H14-R3 TaxID=3046308 RepID=UPI0024BBC414|nr:sensor histidine kinase [Hymenobacter sp. H14-R3]MDJ0363996.1 histidine kinase [Hymenobacter sp. H14-R3]
MTRSFFSLPAVPALLPPASAAPPYANAAPPGTPWVTTVERSNVRAFGRVLGWIALVCAGTALLFAPPPWRDPLNYGISVAIAFSYAAGLWFANAYTADLLNVRTGWGEQPIRRLLLTVGLSLLASLLVIVLVSEGYSVLLFHQRLGYSLRHSFWSQSAFPLLATVVISMFLHSRSFLLAWREATVRAERLEKETAVARLDSLRRQVDPHFLFNSLNALTSLVEENDPARAVRFIRQLSSVYRYVLDSQSQELVSLREELAFAEAYVFLQKTRLDEALQVEFTGVDKDNNQLISSLYLPPLALQLLLENALKHNAAYQADPLRLRVAVDVAAATLTVRNTLRPRRLSANEASGRGLANLRARYGFLTPRPLVAGPAGEEFVVTLPLLAL